MNIEGAAVGTERLVAARRQPAAAKQNILNKRYYFEQNLSKI